MTFTTIENRNGMVNLDGYSKYKNLKTAIRDLAREVSKIDKNEGESIENNLGEMAHGMINVPGCWYITAEKVGCASRINDDDVMEYDEGSWYLYIRFVNKIN